MHLERDACESLSDTWFAAVVTNDQPRLATWVCIDAAALLADAAGS